MGEIRWHEAHPNEDGVKTVAVEIKADREGSQIIGYNGIIKGQQVKYEGDIYTVVTVSPRGRFGLSETGELSETISVSPADVRKALEGVGEIEESIGYRVYYIDKRYSTEVFRSSEEYDTFEKAEEIFNAIKNDDDVLDCHIKRETMTKEIIVQK